MDSMQLWTRVAIAMLMAGVLVAGQAPAPATGPSLNGLPRPTGVANAPTTTYGPNPKLDYNNQPATCTWYGFVDQNYDPSQTAQCLNDTWSSLTNATENPPSSLQPYTYYFLDAYYDASYKEYLCYIGCYDLSATSPASPPSALTPASTPPSLAPPLSSPIAAPPLGSSIPPPASLFSPPPPFLPAAVPVATPASPPPLTAGGPSTPPVGSPSPLGSPSAFTPTESPLSSTTPVSAPTLPVFVPFIPTPTPTPSSDRSAAGSIRSSSALMFLLAAVLSALYLLAAH